MFSQVICCRFLNAVVPVYIIITPELGYTAAKRKKPSNTLVKFSDIFHEYNCIQLIHKEIMGIVGYILFYVLGAFAQFVLYCNFVIIRQWVHLDYYTKV